MIVIKSFIRFFICMFIIVLLVTFNGCGNQENNSELQKYDTKSVSLIQNKTDETTNDTTTGKEYVITNATDFSDGYAWLQVKELGFENVTEHEMYKTVCVNKSGEIQFYLDANDYDYDSQYYMWNSHKLGDEEFSLWHSGTSIVKGEMSSNVKKDRIYDNTGKMIFETDDTYCKVICYADGYYAVMKQEKSIDKNNHYVCFLNTDGTWQKNTWNLDTDSDYTEVDYRGEGIFYCSKNEGKYYNINTNSEFVVKTDDLIGSPCGNFNNGKILYGEGSTYVIDNQGNVLNKIDNTGSSGFNGQYAVLYDSMYSNSEFIKCYDSKNDKIYDIANFTNGVQTFPDNNTIDGDKMIVELGGVDENHYFTTYTTNGKQLYEPIQCDEFKMWSSCDRIIIKIDEKYQVYDYNGKLIFKLDEKQYNSLNDCCITTYSDNVALIRDGNENRYSKIIDLVDLNGDSIFDNLKYQNQEIKIKYDE